MVKTMSILNWMIIDRFRIKISLKFDLGDLVSTLCTIRLVHTVKTAIVSTYQ